MDMVIFTEFDFSIARQVTALCAVAVLIYGFVWEVDR